MSVTQHDIDLLIEESQRLRDELLKAATRLETFADQLVTQVGSLREAATEARREGAEAVEQAEQAAEEAEGAIHDDTH